MKTLKITGCDIGDDGFKAIFDYLDNLEEIYMIKCNITEAAVRELAKVMKDLQNLVKSFVNYCNSSCIFFIKSVTYNGFIILARSF